MSAPDGKPEAGAEATQGDAHGGWVLVATILASSMAFIDGTVVNVALPALQAALHATVEDMQWVVEAYALLLACLLLLGGSLGDIFGRRRVFLCGVVLFALASAGCGLAASIRWLIVARGLQGIGAAFLVPGSLSLISASFPDEERGRAIGTWSGFTAITAAIGPVLGGSLIEHASWRWVFFINLPLAILVVAIALFRVPESRNEGASRKLDWPGAVLVTLGLGGITFALIEAPGGPGRAGYPGTLAAWLAGMAGVLALAGFVWVEAKSAAPMVSLRLFRSRSFSGANLLTFFLYASLSGMLFFLPLDLIQVQHYSAVQAGAALLPLILLIFALSRWSGGLVARYGARLPLTIGSLVAAAGYGLFLLPGVGSSYVTAFLPGIAGLGIGMAISVAPLTTAVMESVPESEAGVASGVNNAVSRIAGLLAVAVFGAVLSWQFNRVLDGKLGPMHLSTSQRAEIDRQRPKLAGAEIVDRTIQQAAERAIDESFVSGYRVVIGISAVMALFSALCAGGMSGRGERAGERVEETGARSGER